MISVLQIVDGKQFSGICKLLLDIEKYLPKDIKFEYLTSVNIIDGWYNLNVNRQTFKGKILFNIRLYKFLKNHKYDIVHINSGAFFFSFFTALVCRLRKVHKIVVHSHNTTKVPYLKTILIKLLNPIYRIITDARLSCSRAASKSLYTKDKDVIFIKNGINIDEYKFNAKLKKEYKKVLNINNKKVYGHIGRFSKQKNHEFLIDVFNEIQKKENAVLLLIGTGELEDDIKNKVRSLDIEDKVLFLGFKEDVNKLLNVIDVFLFPSLYEGLGIVVIEAQTNGIPTFVSNGIPEEANISNNFYKIDKFDIEEWTSKVLSVKLKDRTNIYKCAIKKGFDVKTTSKQLEKIYRELMNK